MTLRSLSVLLCGLLVACIASPRKPAEPARETVRWDTPSVVVEARSGEAQQSPALGDSGAGAVVPSAAVSGSGDGGAPQTAAVSGSGGAGQSVAGAVDTVGARRVACNRAFQGPGVWGPSDADPSPWKSALENYIPTVRQGNLTALNTARAPFAEYLNGMHNRIHPLFVDAFLCTLDRLPSSDPLNDGRLTTQLEIVLNQEAGGIVRMGVIKSSGNTLFDVSVLQAVKRAAPFGVPPREIVSPGGNVYVHWEFRRNSEACSTFNVTPFLLKRQPKADSEGAAN